VITFKIDPIELMMLPVEVLCKKYKFNKRTVEIQKLLLTKKGRNILNDLEVTRIEKRAEYQRKRENLKKHQAVLKNIRLKLAS